MANHDDELLARALAESIRHVGRSLASEPRRVQGMVSDTLGVQARTRRAEIDAVVLAAEESIPEDLLAGRIDLTTAVDRLHERGLDDAVAIFAVEVWRYALGMLEPGARPPTLTNSLRHPDSTLTDAPLTDAALTDAALTDAALTDAALTDAALTDAALTDAALTDAALTDAALTDAALTDVATASPPSQPPPPVPPPAPPPPPSPQPAPTTSPANHRPNRPNARALLVVAIPVVALMAIAAFVYVLGDDASNGDADTASTTRPAANTTSIPTPTTTTSDSTRPSGAAGAAGPLDSPPGPRCSGTADGQLTIGATFPVTGLTDFVGLAPAAAARLAVDDINTAGGVLGQPAILLEGDTGEEGSGLEVETDRILAEGADAIVGAPSWGEAASVIDRFIANCVVQFAIGDSSPNLTAYADDELFFRTIASDTLQGRALAQLATDDGIAAVSLIYEDESPYHRAIAASFADAFEASGGAVYHYPHAWDGERRAVEDLVIDGAADAVVVISASQPEAIFSELHEHGLGPALGMRVYATSDTMTFVGLAADFDYAISAGTLSVIPGTDTSATTFATRLDAIVELEGRHDLGAEAYDAVIITALGAIAADSDDPARIAAEINDVTRSPGIECAAFTECSALLADGQQIDYTGIAGPYDFSDGGEPSVAGFVVQTYDGSEYPNFALDRYIFVE